MIENALKSPLKQWLVRCSWRLIHSYSQRPYYGWIVSVGGHNGAQREVGRLEPKMIGLVRYGHACLYIEPPRSCGGPRCLRYLGAMFIGNWSLFPPPPTSGAVLLPLPSSTIIALITKSQDFGPLRISLHSEQRTHMHLPFATKAFTGTREWLGGLERFGFESGIVGGAEVSLPYLRH